MRRPHTVVAESMPLLPLRGRRLVRYLGVAAILAALVQLVLGGSFAVVALALMATLFGLLGFLALGAYNLGSWVSLLYILGNVLVALYAKTLLGQPLGSHLYASLNSFGVLVISCAALLLALMLARRLGVGAPIFEPAKNPRFLDTFSWACFALGALFWFLNRMFQDPGGSGFGGITIFRNLLFMAVIARTAALLERSENRHAFDARLGWIMATGVFLGLLDNSKTFAALPVVSHFVTVLFYRRGLPLRSITILVVGGVLFGLVIAPLVHALRAMGQHEMSLRQRVDFVTSNIDTLVQNPQQFTRIERLAKVQFQNDYYYNYFGGNGAGQMLLGRYASVQQIDPVIDEVNRSGPQGGQAVWPALTRLVPSFIYPDKPQNTEAFNTLVHYGLVDPRGGKFPTLPLAGQAYAAYGMFGLLTIPFITFVAFFLVLKKLGWQLYRNIYAIFFFCSFVVVYVSQGDFGQYAGAVLRDFPLFTITFLIVGRFCRIRMRPGRGQSAQAARLQRGF